MKQNSPPSVFHLGGKPPFRLSRLGLLAALSVLAAVGALVFGIRASAASTLFVNPDGVCGGNSPCFTTIQGAIDAASAGDTVNVAAATYAEQINVNKALTLLGPNANVNPNTGARVAEAVIIPTASDPVRTTPGGPLVVRLSAAGITFNGFTVDGDNPALTSGILFNGVDVDAEYGIYGTETSNSHSVIVNNIVRNIGENAIWLTDASTSGPKTAGGQISGNRVDNCIGRFGQGIRISDNAWVDVLSNVVTRVRNGIVIENFDGTPPAHPQALVAYNNVSSFRIGIRHNNHYVYSGNGFTISNNTVTPYVQAVRPPAVLAIETPPTAYQAIRVETLRDNVPVVVSDNTLTGNRAAMSAAGYTRVEGLMLTNPANTSPNIVLRGNSVEDFIRGAVNETPAVATFDCNGFVRNTTGVYLAPSATGGLVAHNNNIVGNGTGMQNDGPATVNAQGNWWRAANGPGPVGPGSGDTVSTGVDFSGWLTSESNCPASCPTNVALASYGATATASSAANPNFPASGVIDGEHDGNDWGAGGGWNDATRSVFPDSVEVNLNVTQSVDAIDVYTLKNSPNDGLPVGDATSATSYGIKDFEVQTWNGAAWQTVPGGTVTNNTRAKRRFSFAVPISTDRVRVVVSSSADTVYSRVVEIEVFSCAPVVVPTPTPTPTPTPAPTPCGNNIATAANGSTTVASSTANASFPASSAINGERDGNNWGAGGGWNDATRSVFPDHLQVNFNAARTINAIDVYTLKNSPNNGQPVNDTTSASGYGIKNFDVQFWGGAAWQTVPGGAVVNNTLAKRKLVFAPVTTDRIRVLVHSSNDNTYSRIVEIEAFSCSP